MKIIEMFKTGKPVISFEIFPPKLDTPLEAIYDKLEKFQTLNPDFISVTYGAGGSKKDRTIEIATKIKEQYKIESMAHLTCVGHSLEEIDALLDSMTNNGIENILALRGDPPVGQPDFNFSKNVYPYASGLIKHIKSRDHFCVAAAGYVEGHVDCKRIKDDLYYLKQKVDTGVDFLTTQLFFDNRLFFDFLDRTSAIGINCPITPGIMPIFSVDQILRIASLCGASIPAAVVLILDKYKDSPEDVRKAGIEYASKQIDELISNGVDGIHLLTMNRPVSTKEILQNAGLL